MRRKGIGPFWWGMLTGLLVLCAVFYKKVFAALAAMTGNVFPVLFTPGLFEFTCGLIGFTIVLLVLHFRRGEQRDEWVEIDVSEEAEGPDQ